MAATSSRTSSASLLLLLLLVAAMFLSVFAQNGLCYCGNGCVNYSKNAFIASCDKGTCQTPCPLYCSFACSVCFNNSDAKADCTGGSCFCETTSQCPAAGCPAQSAADVRERIVYEK